MLRHGEKLFVFGEYRVIVVVSYDIADLIVCKTEHHKLSAAYDILHRGVLPIFAGPGVLCFGAAAECNFGSKLAGDECERKVRSDLHIAYLGRDSHRAVLGLDRLVGEKSGGRDELERMVVNGDKDISVSNIEDGLNFRALISGDKNLAELVAVCFNILISCVSLYRYRIALRGYRKLCALYLNIVSTCRVDLLLYKIGLIAGDVGRTCTESDAVDSCIDYPCGL